MKNRQMELDGAYNVRNIGGYTTEDKRAIRWSRLLRGDSTDSLSSSDLEQLLSYGLTSVIDLRDSKGTATNPSVFATWNDVKYTNIGM